MPQTALTPAIRDEIARLGKADIMVGIPSFKNAATIGYVVRAAQAGLVQYFPDLRPVVVNSDAGSPDGTSRVVIETEPPDYVEQILLVRPSHKLERVSLTYPEIEGSGGKGAALRTIFEIAAALEVEALVVVDSDLRSIVPEWIELLAGPILKGGYDFVAPLYARYKYDGTITNTVTYPLTRALYGQPHPPADRRRLRRVGRPRRGTTSTLDDWTPDISKFGIDIWMTTSALAGGFAVCQTRLGAKIHDPKDPGADLGPMFRQVVGTILRLANRYADHWLPIHGSHDVPGLRVRADHRAAAARGEHAAPPLGVPRRLADPRRHVALDARAGDRGHGPGARGRGGHARRRGADQARHRRRRGVDDGDHARDGRGGQHVPLPRRHLGPGRLRPGRHRARPQAVARDAGRRRSCRSTSDGWGASSSRTGTSRRMPPRNGSSARRASSSCSSRTSSSAGRRRSRPRRRRASPR